MRLKIKYPFSIKMLEERLTKEREMLQCFKMPTKHIEWQTANIESCEYRINELLETIKHLKTITING